MLKPLEVLELYPAHDYTLAGAFASRAQRDPSRPFIVAAGDKSVTAVGTAFDVRLEPGTSVEMVIQRPVPLDARRLPRS